MVSYSTMLMFISVVLVVGTIITISIVCLGLAIYHYFFSPKDTVRSLNNPPASSDGNVGEYALVKNATSGQVTVYGPKTVGGTWPVTEISDDSTEAKLVSITGPDATNTGYLAWKSTATPGSDTISDYLNAIKESGYVYWKDNVATPGLDTISDYITAITATGGTITSLSRASVSFNYPSSGLNWVLDSGSAVNTGITSGGTALNFWVSDINSNAGNVVSANGTTANLFDIMSGIVTNYGLSFQPGKKYSVTSSISYGSTFSSGVDSVLSRIVVDRIKEPSLGSAVSEVISSNIQNYSQESTERHIIINDSFDIDTTGESANTPVYYVLRAEDVTPNGGPSSDTQATLKIYSLNFNVEIY